MWVRESRPQNHNLTAKYVTVGATFCFQTDARLCVIVLNNNSQLRGTNGNRRYRLWRVRLTKVA
jgi:hypothetical protein